eukprot:s2400_g3.t3
MPWVMSMSKSRAGFLHVDLSSAICWPVQDLLEEKALRRMGAAASLPREGGDAAWFMGLIDTERKEKQWLAQQYDSKCAEARALQQELQELRKLLAGSGQTRESREEVSAPASNQSRPEFLQPGLEPAVANWQLGPVKEHVPSAGGQDRTHTRGASGSCGSNAPPEVAFPSGPPVRLAPAAAVSAPVPPQEVVETPEAAQAPTVPEGWEPPPPPANLAMFHPGEYGTCPVCGRRARWESRRQESEVILAWYRCTRWPHCEFAWTHSRGVLPPKTTRRRGGPGPDARS